MTDLEFQFDDAHRFAANMARAPKLVEREMVNGANRLAIKGEQYAKVLAPHKSGHLRRSITAEPARFSGGTVTARYGTATPYARAVEEGRRGFGPVNRKALRFMAGDKVVFAKYVGPAKGHW
ncbi:MAG: HK97 gp10 family phage protein, partial [Chloroflexota bacterium]|nr:HK97 gp10 family phage protein [Chloroflexota bacterium]